MSRAAALAGPHERAAGPLAVEVIGSAARLDAIAADWASLFEAVPDAPPFQHPAWLVPWWHAFAPGDLACLAVWEGDALAGFAALYVEQAETGPRLLPLGISLSDYLDVLACPDRRPDVLAAMAAALPAVERLDLSDLPPGAAALGLEAPRGWRREEGPCEACPVLDLAAGFASVPALRRRKLRMARHRAERAGGVAFTPVEQAGADAFLDALVALHRSRWRTRGEEGVLAGPRVEAFHRAALPGLLAAGLADGALLHIGGRLAGAYYGLRRGGDGFAYLSGFDPVFHREAPGTLLVGAAIERTAASGGTFHFLRGREPYKYDWGARDVWTRRLSLVRETRDG